MKAIHKIIDECVNRQWSVHITPDIDGVHISFMLKGEYISFCYVLSEIDDCLSEFREVCEMIDNGASHAEVWELITRPPF